LEGTGPTHSVEDRAKNIFVARYVFGDSPPLDWVKPFYPSAGEDPFFRHTFRAVSLAYLSNETGSSAVQQKARNAYCTALALTNSALHSQDTAKKNTILLTVLLLDLFENLTRDVTTSSTSATKHLDGALALIKFRGNKQFEDPVSLAMFLHLSSILIPSYLERGIPIPKAFVRFRHQAARFACTDDPDWRLSDLMIQMAALQAASHDSDAQKTQALATAQYLDLELLDVGKAMPRPKTLEEMPTQVLNGREFNSASRNSARERNLILVRRLLDYQLGKLTTTSA
jgi:Fungal specific transcription factor domain